MLNNYAVCSRSLPRAFLAGLFAISSLASCGAGDSATTLSGATGGGNPISLDLSLSLIPARTSGVAPLSVFFDATATTDAGVTAHPFHDLEYRWDFGDATAGAWAYGARPGTSSKNSATGAVAAHVFETPGTYTVTLTAFDGTNSATTTTTITVQDANTVFAGTNTICVGATSVPTAGSGGCPAGASTAQQANFQSLISTSACAGCRVLLKRGDTFTTTSEAIITSNGPGIVGAFGTTGAKPLINNTADTSSNTVNTLGFNAAGNTDYTWGDWRIMDLSFNGGGTAHSTGIGISSTSAGLTRILLLRLDVAAFESQIGFGADGPNWINNQYGRSHTIDQIAIVDSTVTNGNNTSYAGYNAGNRFAVMGNRFENGGLQTRYDQLGNALGAGTHVLRFPYLNKAIIAHNDILHPGGSRHCIKIHAPFRKHSDGTPNNANPDPEHGNYSSWSNYSPAVNGDGYSQHVMIADNYMVSAQEPWQVTISPQDSGEDERVRNVILERNYHVGTVYTQIAQVIRSRQITSRNNIFAANGSPGYTYFAQVDRDGGEPPATDVWFYNNTVYKSGGAVNGSDGFAIVNMPNTLISNVTIRNNLGYAPTLTGSVPYVNAGITGLTQSNNSTTAQINGTSPQFTATPPSAITDWKPTCTTTYPCAQGISVPVWSDFFLTGQLGVRDLGAVGH